MTRRRLLPLLAFLVTAGCGGGGAPTAAAPLPAATSSPASSTWVPGTTDTFQWQLNTTTPDTTVNASVYDVDGADTPAQTVATLHAAGRHVVCYMNAGVYENWRADAKAFPQAVIGNADAGWPGEYWLDIRRLDVLGPIMQARMDACKSKGFDAIEPDNIDGFGNATGFTLTAADQLTFNEWLATQAHNRGMSIALKNDNTQAADLLPYFDFALAEDCWTQGWCTTDLARFHAAGKAVFTVEYSDAMTAAAFAANVCPQAKAAGFFALFKNRSLDAYRAICP